MGTDYDALRLAELGSLSECLHELADDDWDVPSLCDGWRVRDVVSHMCVGYTTPMPAMLLKVAKRGFSVPKASREESIAYGTEHTPAELTSVVDEIRTKDIRRGIAKVIKSRDAFVDHVIHHQDIRRPLGRPREIPADRLVAALDVIPGLAGFVGAKRRVAGLRLVATDIDWSHGTGPEVAGPGEALLLAASGRSAALEDLAGDGLPTLRDRLAA